MRWGAIAFDFEKIVEKFCFCKYIIFAGNYTLFGILPNNTVYWDPEAGALLDNGVRLSPATVLNHEADHALQDAENPRQLLKDSKTTDESYQNLEEKRVITGSEQRTALKHGEIKKGQVTRTNHKASYYRTKSPTSTEENTNL